MSIEAIYTTLGAAYSAATALKEITKSLKDAEIKIAIAEVISALAEAKSEAANIKNENADLKISVHSLQQKIASLENALAVAKNPPAPASPLDGHPDKDIIIEVLKLISTLPSGQPALIGLFKCLALNHNVLELVLKAAEELKLIIGHWSGGMGQSPIVEYYLTSDGQKELRARGLLGE